MVAPTRAATAAMSGHRRVRRAATAGPSLLQPLARRSPPPPRAGVRVRPAQGRQAWLRDRGEERVAVERLSSPANPAAPASARPPARRRAACGRARRRRTRTRVAWRAGRSKMPDISLAAGGLPEVHSGAAAATSTTAPAQRAALGQREAGSRLVEQRVEHVVGRPISATGASNKSPMSGSSSEVAAAETRRRRAVDALGCPRAGASDGRPVGRARRACAHRILGRGRVPRTRSSARARTSPRRGSRLNHTHHLRLEPSTSGGSRRSASVKAANLREGGALVDVPDVEQARERLRRSGTSPVLGGSPSRSTCGRVWRRTAIAPSGQ